MSTNTSTAPHAIARGRSSQKNLAADAFLPGLLLTAALGAAAIVLGGIAWLPAHGISALTLAIVLGMLVGNTLYPRWQVANAGVNLAKQQLLRAGIVLYGLRLTFQDIGQVGLTGVAIDAAMLCSTFALAWFAGTRLFGLDRTTTLLIGAGSSICGAAAVMATEPVVRGRPEQVTVAVSTVVLFGTLAIFVEPALYQLNAHFHLLSVSPQSYGVFVGSTVHEVAQVVAAGHAVSEIATNTAVIAKMVRVMMLAPFLVALSALLSRQRPCTTPDITGPSAVHAIVIPWFALGFVAVTALHSELALPAALLQVANQADTLLLAMAMAGLGLATRWSAIRAAGMRPLGLAALLFTWLLIGGIAVNTGLAQLMG